MWPFEVNSTLVKKYSMILLVLLLVSLVSTRADYTTLRREFQNALTFINSVRSSSVMCYNFSLSLPQLILYTPTPNMAVNKIMEERYIEFWQALRQRNFKQDNKQLVEVSMGAALGLHELTKKNAKAISNGTFETNLLKPIFYHNGMKDAYLRCKLQNKDNILVCMEDVVRKCTHFPVVWKEMTLSAIWILRMVVIFATSGSYALLDNLDLLRSDEGAIACVSDWDRVASIPKVLYLRFLLHARQLIAHMTGNAEEAKAVAKLLLDLDLLVTSEFPSKLIRVVKQEQAVNGALYIGENPFTKRKQSIKQVKLISVKQKDREIPIFSTLFADEDTLYVSVPEYSLEGKNDGVMEMFRKIMSEVNSGSLTLKTNPMAYGG